MLKHIGLSLCLCLIAMGLNSVFVTQSDAQQQSSQGTRDVTNIPPAFAGKNSHAESDHSTHRMVHAMCDVVAAGEFAQRSSSIATSFLFKSCRGTP